MLPSMGQAGFGEPLICGAATFTETSKLEAVVLFEVFHDHVESADY
jgi:hypothetical protein